MEEIHLQLSQIWTSAGVLAGFQLIALSWRIQREVKMELLRERTWITIADYIAVVSLLMLALGVFAAPVLNIYSVSIAVKVFGAALVVFVSHPIILLGHYNLYCSWDKYDELGKPKPRPPITNQEKVASVACAFLFLIYAVLAGISIYAA